MYTHHQCNDVDDGYLLKVACNRTLIYWTGQDVAEILQNCKWWYNVWADAGINSKIK